MRRQGEQINWLQVKVVVDRESKLILTKIKETIHSLKNPNHVNPLRANPTKWPNTLKQFVGKLPTNCLSVFGHFINLALKGLTK